MYLDSLLARGLISPDAMANLLQRTAGPTRPPWLGPSVGPEMGPRGGPRTYTGASGEKVTAPDYGRIEFENRLDAQKENYRGYYKDLTQTPEVSTPKVSTPEIVPDKIGNRPYGTVGRTGKQIREGLRYRQLERFERDKAGE